MCDIMGEEVLAGMGSLGDGTGDWGPSCILAGRSSKHKSSGMDKWGLVTTSSGDGTNF